jgi:hypothetical protein
MTKHSSHVHHTHVKAPSANTSHHQAVQKAINSPERASAGSQHAAKGPVSPTTANAERFSTTVSRGSNKSVTTESRNFERELQEIDSGLEELNAEYDRLAATGATQAMDRVDVLIAVAQQRRRNVKAAQRGESDIRRAEEKRLDGEKRTAAYQLCETAITTVHREALVIDRLVGELRECFVRLHAAEKDIVPPVYAFMPLRDREFASVELASLLANDCQELEQLLRGTRSNMPQPSVAKIVASRCAQVRSQIQQILFPAEES